MVIWWWCGVVWWYGDMVWWWCGGMGVDVIVGCDTMVFRCDSMIVVLMW